MGTEYYVACRDCKKVRGLDKFYAMTIPAHGRSEALALGEELQKGGWSFRCALLTSFLWQHKGHNCTVFSEYDEEFMSMVPLADEPKAGDYEDDSDRFWNTLDQGHRMTDSTTPQDGKAMSPASLGSVSEPAAWGVLRAGGGWVSILANKVQAETSRKSWDNRENWVHDVVPLYRQPTLTDAERRAVEEASEFYIGTRTGVALHGLLERLK